MAGDLKLKLVIEGDAADALDELKGLTAALERLNAQDVDIGGIERLARDVEAGRIQVDRLDARTRALVQDFQKVKKASRGAFDARQVRRMRGEIDKTRRSVGGLANDLAKVRSVIAAAAAGTGIGAIAAAALDMEQAMAQVAKTTGLAGDDLDRLKRQLQDMAEQTGTATDELARMATVGGQLGVPADQIRDFVELANEMGVAFDISAERAADAIGTLTNAMGLSLDEVRALGDAINVLGNEMAAREADIVNVVTRTAGMARTFGLAKEETAALAAAFLSLGKTPEVAATAINALLNKLQTAPAQGKQFQQALDSLGLSAERLSANIQQNAIGAITDLLSRLKSLPPQMRAIAATQLFGQEFQDDVNGLVSSLDVLNRALAKVRGNTQGAMHQEFLRQLETAQKSIDRLKVAAINLAEALGSQLLDDLAAAADSLADLTNAVRDFVQQNPQVVEMAKTLAEIVAITKGLSLTGKALGALSGRLANIGKAAAGVKQVSGALKEIGPAAAGALPAIAALAANLTSLRLALVGFGGFQLGKFLTEDLGAASERVKAFGAQVANEFEQIKITAEAIFQAIATQSTAPLEALPEKIIRVRQAFIEIGQSFENTAAALEALDRGVGIDGLVAMLNQGQLTVDAFTAALDRSKFSAEALVAAMTNLTAQTPGAVFDTLNTALANFELTAQQTGQYLQALTQAFLDGRLGIQQYTQVVSTLAPSAQQLQSALAQIQQAVAQTGGASTQTVQAMAMLEQAMTQSAASAGSAAGNLATVGNAAAAMGSAAGQAAGGMQQVASATQATANGAAQASAAINQATAAISGYSSATGQLDAQLAKLAQQFNQGAISAEEFAAKSRELVAAHQESAQAAGAEAENVAQLNQVREQSSDSVAGAAAAEERYVQSLQRGIDVIRQYRQAVEELRQAKIAAAQAPPVRPEQGGGRADREQISIETSRLPEKPFTIFTPFSDRMRRALANNPNALAAVQQEVARINRMQYYGVRFNPQDYERRLVAAAEAAAGSERNSEPVSSGRQVNMMQGILSAARLAL